MSSSDPLTAPRPNRNHYGKRALASAQRSAKANTANGNGRSSLPTTSTLSSPLTSPSSSPTRAPAGGVTSRSPIGGRDLLLRVGSSVTRSSPRGSAVAVLPRDVSTSEKGKGKQVELSSALSSTVQASSPTTRAGVASPSQRSPPKRALPRAAQKQSTTAAEQPTTQLSPINTALQPPAAEEDDPDDGSRSPPPKRSRPSRKQFREAILKSHTVDTSARPTTSKPSAKQAEPPTTPTRKTENKPTQSQAGASQSGVLQPRKAIERSASGRIVANMSGRSTPRPRSPSRERTPLSWVTGSHSQPVQGSPQLESPGFVVNAPRAIITSPGRPLGLSNTSPNALSVQPSPARVEQPAFQPSQFQAPLRPSAVRPLGRASSTLAGAGASTLKRTYGGARKIKPDEVEEAIFSQRPVATSSSSPGPEGGEGNGSKARVKRRGGLPNLGGLGLIKDRESYSALRKKFGADEEEQDYEQSQALTDLRTVNQQRARGENTRFEDKFQYMVEGLGPKEPLSLRRSSAVEVLKKMLDTDFTRRLKSAGFIERVYSGFRQAGAGSGDRVLDPALAYFVATVARDQRVAEALILLSPAQFDKGAEENPFDPKSDLIAVLSEMLSRPWAGEVVGPEVKGLSKPETLVMRGLRETIDKSNLIEPGSFEVTLRSLALVAISVIASFEPRPNFKPQERLVAGGALDGVCEAFVQETNTFQIRVDRYIKGLDLLPPDGTVSLTLIDTCVRLLEAIGNLCAEAAETLERHMHAIAPAFTNTLLVAYLLANSAQDKRTAQRAVDCLVSVLTMLIQLTLDPDWCASLAKDPALVSTLVRLVRATRTPKAREGKGIFDVGMTEGSEEDKEGVQRAEGKHNSDVLCLAVGVLVYMAELAEDVKHAIRNAFLDSNCKEERRCAKECQCPNRASAIHVLLDLHADDLDDIKDGRLAPATEESEEGKEEEEVEEGGEQEGEKEVKEVRVTKTHVNGCAAILLGLVMVDAPENQDIVYTALKDQELRLNAVLGALEKFADLHETGEEGTQRSEEGAQEEGAFAAKVRETVAELRRRVNEKEKEKEKKGQRN